MSAIIHEFSRRKEDRLRPRPLVLGRCEAVEVEAGVREEGATEVEVLERFQKSPQIRQLHAAVGAGAGGHVGGGRDRHFRHE